jgi:vancomycin permeability regulator SanA
MLRNILRPIIALLFFPALLFLLIWGAGQVVSVSTSDSRYYTAEDTPSKDLAVVFGAGLKRSGEVGNVLKARLDDAIKLYNLKKVTGIVVSGDNTDESYDEVTPMVTYLISQDIPESAILTDRKGTSTYDTCYQLKNTLKVDRAVLVTNDFHLPRAVYTCRKLGVDVVGLATPNYPGFESNSNQRESLARVKMLIDLYVAPPTPLPN